MIRSRDTAMGRAELLADADRPAGWLLTIDRIRQSYVDLDDPTYLDFEYVQAFADVLDALPPGPLAVTHVGGGAATLARYVAVSRPGSPQIVLEPDAELTDFVRALLPFPRGHRIRVRAVDGRAGVAALRDGSADLVVLDAFHGGRVPPELATAEFLADVARVLRPAGVFLANVADGSGVYGRRFADTVRTQLAEVAVIADPAVLKARRFGNLVVAAARSGLPVAAIQRAAARAPLPRVVALDHGARGRPLTDAAPMRSPMPPEHTWRVADWDADDDPDD